MIGWKRDLRSPSATSRNHPSHDDESHDDGDATIIMMSPSATMRSPSATAMDMNTTDFSCSEPPEYVYVSRLEQ
jgi:hypothetical protein